MTVASSILFDEGKELPAIAPCDHYAGSVKLIEKSLEIQAELGPVFDITCDLEDGAKAGEEAGLRRAFSVLINSQANKFEQIGLRIRDYSSPSWKEDVMVVLGECGARISHLTIPKCTSLGTLEEMLEYIRRRENELGLKRTIPIHVLIETPGAIRDIWKIAALPGLRTLDFGAMDFVSSLHGALDSSCFRSPRQFEHPIMVRAKTDLVLAALENGLVPVHNVTPEFTDNERTFDDALRARTQFGFLRMWSIHPNQIKPIVDAMMPDLNEIERASSIILQASKASWGPIRHNDELHDRASYRYFYSFLKRANKAGAKLSPEITALLS